MFNFQCHLKISLLKYFSAICTSMYLILKCIELKHGSTFKGERGIMEQEVLKGVGDGRAGQRGEYGDN